jgi:hypothetical protein
MQETISSAHTLKIQTDLIPIFGMIFLFGGIAWALGPLYLPKRRTVLRRLAVDGLLTAPPVMILLLPVLVHMARHADTVNLPGEKSWPPSSPG